MKLIPLLFSLCRVDKWQGFEVGSIVINLFKYSPGFGSDIKITFRFIKNPPESFLLAHGLKFVV